MGKLNVQNTDLPNSSMNSMLSNQTAAKIFWAFNKF